LWRKEELAKILGKISPAHPEAIRVLSELIQLTPHNNERNEFLVAEAAKDWGIIAPNNTDAIDTLIELQHSAQDRLNDFLNQLGISNENVEILEICLANPVKHLDMIRIELIF
jgi:hypothetical protein